MPFLRDEHYDDMSTSSEATISASRQAKLFWGENYNIVTQLMPNCPLRNSNDIKNALKAFHNNKRVFQISCFKFGWMNPWWAFKLDENSQPVRIFPEAQEQRSQDLPELYCPTGAIWIAKCEELVSEGTFMEKITDLRN